MKVVYFGSDVFLSCFEYFLQEHEILALYTYHNNEDYFTEYAIVEKAREHGIAVYYEPISPERIARYFMEEGCELFFVAEYSRILHIPADLPQFRGVNIHSSLLPQGRSYYPIEAAMDQGLARSGVTMHKIFQELDSGDILAQRTIEITEDTDSVDVYLQCGVFAREMTELVMENIDQYWETAQPQQRKCPYWKRPDAARMTLDHQLSRQEACSKFRKYNSMTQVQLNDSWFYVTALEEGTGPMDREVRFLSPTRLLYRVKDGHLRLHICPMEEEK